MSFLRPMMGNRWAARVTDNICLEMANETDYYTQLQENRQTSFGYIMREEVLDNIVRTEKSAEDFSRMYKAMSLKNVNRSVPAHQ